MALFDTTRPAAAGLGLRGFAAQMVGTFAAWNDARTTRDALSRLSAHELDDIGLTAGDIDRIAAGDLRR